jgi:membrane associated rhomboid family serine protease
VIEPFITKEDRENLEANRKYAAVSNMTPQLAEVRRQQDHVNKMGQVLEEMIRNLSPYHRYGYIPARPSFFTLLSSMFMHGGFLHLLGNLFFFFASGPFVEDVFGRPAFTFLYMTGGFAATWAHAWQNPGSIIPTVGASGAIAAIMGAYLVRFFRARVEFLFIPIIVRPTISFRFFLPAFVVLPLWFIWQFWEATHGAGESGVAFWAHVGGFAYGAAFAGLLQVTDFEKKFVDPSVEKQTMWKQNEHFVLAQEARAKWDFDTARRELQLLLKEEPNSIDGLRASFDIATIDQKPRDAADAAARLLDVLVKMEEKEMVIDLLREVSGVALVMPERYYTRAAGYLERIGEPQWALDYCNSLTTHHPESAGAMRALMQAARIYRQMQRPDLAKLALQKAKSHPTAGAEWQRTISAQLAELDHVPRLPIQNNSRV